MALFNRQRRDADCIFLTLTYHRCDPTAEEAKDDLNALRTTLGRRWSDHKTAAVWRMEWQDRGVPHIHLLVYGLRYDAKDALKRIWHRVSGERSAWERFAYGPTSHRNHRPFFPAQIESVTSAPLHRHLGAWVEGLSSENDSKKAAHYVSKYHAKTEDAGESDEWTGRRWGVWWRDNLPVADVTHRIEVPYSVAWHLVALVLEDWGSDDGYVPQKIFIGSNAPKADAKEYLLRAAERAAVSIDV